MKALIIIMTLLTSISACGNKSSNSTTKELTAQMVIDQIKEQVTCDWAEKTVDTFKTGNPDDVVTGIAVCMFADMKLLKQAVANNCNLIITHEPTFYNHLDETEFLKDDPVFQDKMKYINDHKLIVFRFHDHIHRTKPDGIYVGMIDELGWNDNKVDGSPYFYQFEKQKLSEFAEELADIFDTKDLRVIGNPDMSFTKVALSVGAPGSRSHIKTLQDEKTEVIIAGEAPEWETYEYVYDAVEQGKNKAVVFLGHIHSEEAGMKYCADWLKGFVKDVPIKYFRNGQTYWSPK